VRHSFVDNAPRISVEPIFEDPDKTKHCIHVFPVCTITAVGGIKVFGMIFDKFSNAVIEYL